MCIFDGLQIDQLHLPRLRRGPEAWKYVVIGHDSAIADIPCNRYVDAGMDIFPCSLPIFQPHILLYRASFSFRCRFQRPVGSCAHSYREGFSDIGEPRRALLTGGEIANPLSIAEDSKALRMPFMDKVLSTNMPVFQKDRGGRCACIIRRFAEYCPLGLPRPHQNSQISSIRTFDLAWALLVEVFDRNAPIPIITRWRTVEMSEWRMIGIFYLLC